MKKLLISSFLLCMSCIIFAQPGKIKPPEDIYADTKKSPQIYLGRQILQSPGSYLIKARNQILSGFGCGITSGIVLYVGSTIYTNQLANNHWKYIATSKQGIQERKYLETERNLCYIGAGVLGLVGLSLEISGIVNIGKAGFSLNENGVGVKVKF